MRFSPDSIAGSEIMASSKGNLDATRLSDRPDAHPSQRIGDFSLKGHVSTPFRQFKLGELMGDNYTELMAVRTAPGKHSRLPPGQTHGAKITELQPPSQAKPTSREY